MSESGQGDPSYKGGGDYVEIERIGRFRGEHLRILNRCSWGICASLTITCIIGLVIIVFKLVFFRKALLTVMPMEIANIETGATANIEISQKYNDTILRENILNLFAALEHNLTASSPTSFIGSNGYKFPSVGEDKSHLHPQIPARIDWSISTSEKDAEGLHNSGYNSPEYNPMSVSKSPSIDYISTSMNDPEENEIPQSDPLSKMEHFVKDELIENDVANQLNNEAAIDLEGENIEDVDGNRQLHYHQGDYLPPANIGNDSLNGNGTAVEEKDSLRSRPTARSLQDEALSDALEDTNMSRDGDPAGGDPRDPTPPPSDHQGTNWTLPWSTSGLLRAGRRSRRGGGLSLGGRGPRQAKAQHAGG